jgi:thioredoxin 1
MLPLARPVLYMQMAMKKTEHIDSPKAGSLTVNIAEVNFGAEVLQSKQPVLVEFWTPWSRPCQVLESILQDIAHSWAGKARVVRVNADDSLDLSLFYDIQSIPTLIYFLDGKARVRIVGTASKEAILGKLRPLGVPGETDLPPTTALGAGRSPGKKD